MVGFEVSHGNHGHVKAFSEMERLVNKLPTVVGLWLLYARYGSLHVPQCLVDSPLPYRNAVLVQESPEVIVRRALTACPHEAQLYYFAARLELLALPSGSRLDVTECSQRAIDWLERCIKSFYKSPTSSVEPSLLYRYVLYRWVWSASGLEDCSVHVYYGLYCLSVVACPFYFCYVECGGLMFRQMTF